MITICIKIFKPYTSNNYQNYKFSSSNLLVVFIPLHEVSFSMCTVLGLLFGDFLKTKTRSSEWTLPFSSYLQTDANIPHWDQR